MFGDDNTMILCIFAKTYLIVEMRLCNTIPARLLAKNKCKRYNTLNTNDLEGYYAAGNPFNILTNNLFRCHTKAPDGCVVSLSDSTIKHVIHVIGFAPNLSTKSVSSHNKFQDRKKA